jgi:hypothetical protein
MWKAALVGAMALTITGSAFVSAEEITGTTGARYTIQSQGNGEVDSKIARAKAVLRLTPDQERHWPRVEAALREVAQRRNNVEQASAGNIIYRIGARAGDMALNASSIRKLVSAAQPLIKVLDEDQKRDAMRMARAMGLNSVAERFE